MSFSCTTSLNCDICKISLVSNGKRMCDCASRLYFEKHICKQKGWKVFYGKFHVCKMCAELYGVNYLRAKYKEKIKSYKCEPF